VCEGNFGLSNSSLWNINLSENSSIGSIYKLLTGSDLGDVGQSLTVANNNLYIIINNSHIIRVLELNPEVKFSRNISLPNASPREMVVHGDFGYVSCWNLEAILKIDLKSESTEIDTIPIPGKPEGMMIHDNELYVSIVMNTDWSNADQVVKISLARMEIEESYAVIPGPGSIIQLNDNLFVSGTYYDQAWNKYSGLSQIELNSGVVKTIDYGASSELVGDLIDINGQIYRVTGSGLFPVKADLSLDSTASVINRPDIYTVYALEEKIVVGTTDFQAPDTVYVFDLEGNLDNEFTVGVLPGDIISIED
jgi:hypothetical protein